MTSIKLHAKADADGMVHLDLPIAQPNAELDVEILIMPKYSPALRKTFYSWDMPFFEHVLGDRIARRQRAELAGKSK